MKTVSVESSRDLVWRVRFDGLRASPATEAPAVQDALKIFNATFLAAVSNRRAGVIVADRGSGQESHVLFEGRLRAATVDDAWRCAISVSEAASAAAWNALRSHLNARGDSAVIGWVGPGVGVYAERTPGEMDVAFVARRRQRPSASALRALPSESSRRSNE